MIKQSILKTLAYFDIFNYPLTKEEIFRYLYKDNVINIEYPEFINQLQQLQQLHHLQHHNGLYFLPGREEIVNNRQDKVKIMDKKLKIARRGIKKIASVPFVRAVFVCNTLSGPGLEDDSDIDVFIIVKNRRLWLTRLLVTLKLSFFRLRRTKHKIKNRICLSFYLSDYNLNLEKIAIKDDVYLVYWLAQLVPFYDPDNFYEILIGANKWVEKYLANGIQSYDMSLKYKVESRKCERFTKNFLEKMWGGGYGDLIEGQARGIQQAKMKMNFGSVQNAGDTRVVINDKMLKFHEKDRRVEYREEWIKKCKEFGI